MALQKLRLQRRTQGGGQGGEASLRQEMGLVVAALAQPKRMQRDRHHDVAPRKPPLKERQPEPGQRLRQIVASLPLEGNDRLGQGSAVLEGRTHRRQLCRPGGAVTAATHLAADLR